MISVRRRRLAAASLAVVATFTLTACGTSFDAQTNKVYQPAVGANARGDVDVLGAQLVANTDGSATLSASLVNNTEAAQDLSSVAVTTVDDKTLNVRGSETELEPGVLTKLGGAGTTGLYVVGAGAPTGEYVKITLTFSDSGAVTIQAPVVARTAEYDQVAGGDGLVPAEVSGAESE